MSQKYLHIPQQLLDYRSPKLLEAFSQRGKKTVWLEIDELFEIVSGITQMQPVALLSCLGFDPKN